MPLFDYKCSNCGATTDRLHKYSEQITVLCQCETIMERQIGVPAFHFKDGKGTVMGNTMSIANVRPNPKD